MFAKVKDGMVILLVEDMPIVHPDLAAMYHSCDEEVQVGYLYDEETDEFSAPPEKTEEELLDFIRKDRNARIAYTDWTQTSDFPGSPEKKEEFAAYRQVLRDFPDNCDPHNPVWPEAPSYP